MRPLLVSATLVAVAATTTLAFASGGAPPADTTAPAPNTVVAAGAGSADVARPARLTSARIARAVDAARKAAIPAAVAAARKEAETMARAAGLTLGRTVAVAHYDPPYYGQDLGRFGVDRWCGRTRVGRRGERQWRWRCFPPARQTAWVKITVEAQ